jgi:putative hydrolase of the HAD superfamily
VHLDVDVVAFDGDDTLWRSEALFTVTQAEYRALMAPHAAGPDIDQRLFDTEMRNLRRYGYGAKSFTLSMIETAIDVSGGAVTAVEIRRIIELGHALIEHPVELLPGVAAAVEAAATAAARVLLITKGDLFHQESKLARSGLGDRFTDVEIVSEKDSGTYTRLFARHDIDADRFVMVGDSMRSDIEPVLSVGGWAVHVPHEHVWQHERVEDTTAIDANPRFTRLASLAELPALFRG